MPSVIRTAPGESPIKKLLPLLCAIAAPLLAGADEPNEAEKLFREMEAKLAKAKAVECVYTVEEDGKAAFRGSALLGEGNKCRIEIAADANRVSVISNGAKVVRVDDNEAKPMTATPAWVDDFLRVSLGRGGFFSSSHWEPVCYRR
jgi:hypothetical protein